MKYQKIVAARQPATKAKTNPGMDTGFSFVRVGWNFFILYNYLLEAVNATYMPRITD